MTSYSRYQLSLPRPREIVFLLWFVWWFVCLSAERYVWIVVKSFGRCAPRDKKQLVRFCRVIGIRSQSGFYRTPGMCSTLFNVTKVPVMRPAQLGLTTVGNSAVVLACITVGKATLGNSIRDNHWDRHAQILLAEVCTRWLWVFCSLFEVCKKPHLDEKHHSRINWCL